MSSSNKRERELARQKYERQQQRRAAREAQRQRRSRIAIVVAALVVVVGAVVAIALSTRGSSEPAASASPTASATTSASPSASTPSSSASPSGTASVKACAKAPTPTTKTQTWSAPGGSPLPATPPTLMKLATNCGDIVIEMDTAKAPKTTQSMAFLAAQDYYTDSDCFRLTVTGLFVLQCGSPTNNGQGGPGYQLPDENLPAAGTNNYPEGTVAMANAGAGTSGSQFFIVYKDTTLGPDYTIWGKVVSGLDVVKNVAAGGVQTGAGAPAPNQTIVITKATTGTALAG